MTDKPPWYWFAAKRYGYGWGLPRTWEGWLVLGAWLAVYIAAKRYLIPHDMYARLAFTVVMIALLLSICYAKGEPARWRFGDRN